jgi:ParB family transcriptional regulator, chromosome partitioning protein
MKGHFARKKISDLKRKPVRLDCGTKDDQIARARSWLRRPIHPIVCGHDLTVVHGHLWLAGLELIGETEVDVFITEEVLTDLKIKEIGLVSALHRKALSATETALLVRDILAGHPGMSNRRSGEDGLSMDPSWPTRLLSLFECIEEVQVAAGEGKLGISEWYAISKAPKVEQAALLALKLAGATRDALESHGREE